MSIEELAVGIDAVDVVRFRSLLDRRPGATRRLFTYSEQEYAMRSVDPAPRLAARFAAKEATMKALGAGLGAFPFRDVEVLRTDSGQPVLRLRGAAAELAEDRSVERWRVSITHTDSLAEAIVVALGGPARGGRTGGGVGGLAQVGGAAHASGGEVGTGGDVGAGG